MNVPKNLYNSFGKYYFRNAESIEAAAKPICLEYKTTLVTTTSVETIGERHYVKATAVLYDWESSDKIAVEAYAREPKEKKGMDESQITGSATSYAKKYALDGLFNLDDMKDADSEEVFEKPKAKSKIFDEPDTEKEKLIEDFFRRLSSNQIDFIYKKHGVNDAAELTVAQLKGYIDLQKSRENEKR